MAEDLSGQVAIVTGGGRGFGQEIAKGLAAAGAAVCVTSRTQSQLDETVAAIEAAGGKAIGLEQDVTVQADWDRVVAADGGASRPDNAARRQRGAQRPGRSRLRGRPGRLGPHAGRQRHGYAARLTRRAARHDRARRADASS